MKKVQENFYQKELKLKEPIYRTVRSLKDSKIVAMLKITNHGVSQLPPSNTDLFLPQWIEPKPCVRDVQVPRQLRYINHDFIKKRQDKVMAQWKINSVKYQHDMTTLFKRRHRLVYAKSAPTLFREASISPPSSTIRCKRNSISRLYLHNKVNLRWTIEKEHRMKRLVSPKRAK